MNGERLHKRWCPVEILAVVGFIALWILLQAVILPKMGVPT
jgi:hypothetical protein